MSRVKKEVIDDSVPAWVEVNYDAKREVSTFSLFFSSSLNFSEVESE